MQRIISNRLAQAGCDSPMREAQMLIEFAAGDAQLLELSVQRRCAREPMSHILGTRGFWEHDFICTPHVLTPRPDSEVLIEEALKCLPDKSAAYRFCDLGTGSGCLLLTLLHEFKAASGVGVDISADALEVAKRNASIVRVQNRVEFLQANWAEGLTEAFDLVISNPPYIPQADLDHLMPEVRNFEPIGALIGGEDGLQFYREIIHQAPNILGNHGWLILEVGQGQAQDVATMGQQNGFELHKIRKDYGGIARAVVLRKR